MNDELYGRVKAFVAKETRVSPKKFTKLTPDIQLEDLGVYGDDGVDLIAAFCEEFSIQNTSEIDLTKHFAPEGCNPFVIFVDLYYLVFDREKLREETNGYIPITLRDLVRSAEAKRWIPPQNQPKSGWW